MRNHDRKPNRHRNFNYSMNGAYFITICTRDILPWFGEIHDDEMILNERGLLARELWLEIPCHYSGVKIYDFVIMPNHIHGIIVIDRENEHPARAAGAGVVGTGHCPVPTIRANTDTTCRRARPAAERYGLISKIINSYKNVFTKTIRKNFDDYGFRWQRSFYDRVIRDDDALNCVRWYIRKNPQKWWRDKNNKNTTQAAMVLKHKGWFT